MKKPIAVHVTTSMTELEAASPPVFRQVDGFAAIHAEQRDLREMAYAAAVESRSLKVDASKLEALEEAARGRLRSHNVEPYDPARNPDDRAREERYVETKAQAEQVEQAVQLAEARVRENRLAAARLNPGIEPVVTPALWVVVVTATAALAATLIPTIIDTLS